MGRFEQSATAPARLRRGLPIVADGSARRPLLVALPGGGEASRCNNGCPDCLTRAVHEASAPIEGRHVVVRDREPTLREDLAKEIRALADRRPASLALLTNGRMLVYPRVARALVRAGVTRFVVKLFGAGAAAHDAHTRAPGSFDQALAGIAAVRALGVEAVVTFPLGKRDEELARALTGKDPVEMPEPEVVVHANEYRYDVVLLSAAGRASPLFSRWYFPMAHVQTGPRCNIRCLYCNVHGGDDPRLYDREHVERMVDYAADGVLRAHAGAGRPTVDFIGGEPTLHPDLPALIRHARDRGFPEVSICTNGVLFHKRPGSLDALVDAGLTMVRYSFHDHRADAANRLADARGLDSHYPETARALLARRDLHTHFYRILLAGTLDALPEYLRFLAAENRTGAPIDLALGMPSMRGRLFENRDLYPPLERLRDAVGAALLLARELGIDLFLHHAPACLAPAEPALASCLHVETWQLDAIGGSGEVLSFEGDARHGAACSACPARETGCHGLPGAYFDADPAAAEAWLTKAG